MNDPHPPVAELLTQAGPMRLVGCVLAHDAESTRCGVDPARSALFLEAGRIPAWVGIEYMAQCIAVHAGLLARARDEAPVPGLFLGSRKLVFHCDSFALDEALEVTARHVAGRGPQRAFACSVLGRGGETLVEGRLNVVAVPDLATRMSVDAPEPT